ncbi:MAG: hypothetical protein LUD78_09060 [Clostridiales bacterium]|nr:hypothetical protein [Clostridiales bacterium]
MKDTYMQGISGSDRWVCPRCGRENGPGVICPDCGFDESTDYLAYPTLMQVPQGGTVRWTEEEQKQIDAEV